MQAASTMWLHLRFGCHFSGFHTQFSLLGLGLILRVFTWRTNPLTAARPQFSLSLSYSLSYLSLSVRFGTKRTIACFDCRLQLSCHCHTVAATATGLRLRRRRCRCCCCCCPALAVHLWQYFHNFCIFFAAAFAPLSSALASAHRQR